MAHTVWCFLFFASTAAYAADISKIFVNSGGSFKPTDIQHHVPLGGGEVLYVGEELKGIRGENQDCGKVTCADVMPIQGVAVLKDSQYLGDKTVVFENTLKNASERFYKHADYRIEGVKKAGRKIEVTLYSSVCTPCSSEKYCRHLLKLTLDLKGKKVSELKMDGPKYDCNP